VNDVRCVKCGRKFMEFIPPKPVPVEENTVFVYSEVESEGFNIDEPIKIPVNIILCGVMYKKEYERNRLIDKALSFLKEEKIEFVDCAFKVVCGRCKTAQIIRTVPEEFRMVYKNGFFKFTPVKVRYEVRRAQSEASGLEPAGATG